MLFPIAMGGDMKIVTVAVSLFSFTVCLPAFAQVIVGLYSIGAVPEVLALATNAANEEVEHAQMCHRLGTGYIRLDQIGWLISRNRDAKQAPGD